MTYSNEFVIKSFAKDKINKNASRVYSKDNVCFSYGYHFPLLIRTKNNLLVLNTDKYSISTTRHQNIAMRYADIEFSFSAFNGLCVKYNILSPYESYYTFFDKLKLIDSIEPRIDILGYKCYYDKKTISISQFEFLTEKDQNDYYKIKKFRPRSSLFEYEGIDNQFFASMDKDQFFITELNSVIKFSLVDEVLKAFKIIDNQLKEREIDNGN